MESKGMVFINVATETKLSVQLELPDTSISFTARDESFIEEIMSFINKTRIDENQSDEQTLDPQLANLEELDLSEKLSIPVLLSKDPEVEDRFFIQLKFSETSSILHAISAQELESLLVAFKDAEIQTRKLLEAKIPPLVQTKQ